jgi:ComF family protein
MDQKESVRLLAAASSRAVAGIERGVGWAADLLLPRACATCGELLEPGGGPIPLCAGCRSRIKPIAGRRCARCGDELVSEAELCMDCRDRDRELDEAFPLFRFEGLVRSLLSAYKFKDRRSLAPFFAGLVAEEARARWDGWTIVPVPPRPDKLRERGWDQVEDIARELERRGFEVARVLERRGESQQKRLDKEARRANARAAYRLRGGSRAPLRALLVDDVVTTGATADACARALKEGGSERVALIALAAD